MQQLILAIFLVLPDTMFVFYSPDCSHCAELISKLELLEHSVVIKFLNMETDSSVLLLSKIEEKVDTFGNSLPVIYYKGKLYYGTLPFKILNIHNNSILQNKKCKACRKVKKRAP